MTSQASAGSPTRSRTLLGLAIGCCLLAPLFAVTNARAAEGPGDASTRPTAPTARIVTTGGLSQRIICQGSGPFTMVVIPGLEAGVAQWADVLPSLAAKTRTCIYDRPGIGRSPDRTDRSVTTADRQARELHALLAAAGEPGPYLVLGHSYGGLIGRSFAHDYTPAVAGLLLMEGVDPKGSGSRIWHESGQPIDMVRSRAQAGGLTQLDAPLLVLSASDPGRDHLGGPSYGDSPASIASWRRQQSSALGLSANSMQVIAHAGHVVQQDNPKAVIAAVSALLDATTTGTPLHCGQAWHAVNARCVMH